MKTKLSTLIIASLAAALTSPAFALEAPADDAPPPQTSAHALAGAAVDAQANQPLHFEPLPGEKKLDEAQNKAFLGIVTSDVPDILAEHLALKDGEGIVVRSLMPDGPAAKAGVSVNDVITHVGDKVINSPEDISKCVAAQNPGEKVTLGIIHKGKPEKIDITLGTRPADVASVDPTPLDQLNLDEFPKDIADRIRSALKGNGGGLAIPDANGALGSPQMKDAMRQLKQQMKNALNPADDAKPGIHMQTGATFRMKDNEGSVEIKSNNGSKEVTIRDQADKVTWSGPWDTEQDKAAAPANIRARVDSLNLDTSFKGNGIKLKFNQAPDPGPNGP